MQGTLGNHIYTPALLTFPFKVIIPEYTPYLVHITEANRAPLENREKITQHTYVLYATNQLDRCRTHRHNKEENSRDH